LVKSHYDCSSVKIKVLDPKSELQLAQQLLSISKTFMPNESNNSNQPNQAETKADSYDKEKDTAQQENKQPASVNNNTSTQEQEIQKEQKETD
jgi:hypothetical protein